MRKELDENRSRHSLSESLVCIVSLGLMVFTFYTLDTFEDRQKKRFCYFSRS